MAAEQTLCGRFLLTRMFAMRLRVSVSDSYNHASIDTRNLSGGPSMDSIATIQRLHQHHQWVNKKLLDVASQLSRDQLDRQFEMGQGCIWMSLLHLYRLEYLARSAWRKRRPTNTWRRSWEVAWKSRGPGRDCHSFRVADKVGIPHRAMESIS